MLEKVAGVAWVNKLRAILLMEADFNYMNEWIFGHEAIQKDVCSWLRGGGPVQSEREHSGESQARQQTGNGPLLSAMPPLGNYVSRC
jgi:hypothetical protein